MIGRKTEIGTGRNHVTRYNLAMTIEKALRWVVLGGIFLLPFIVFLVVESLFFPFITGKNFAFRIIVEVITGAWLALALVNPIYRPRRSWLLGAFALFVIIIAAADAFGVNPFKSFWSNFERMDGWITLAHLFLYFVVTSAMLGTERLWRTFWQVSLGVSAVVGLHAILQFFGVVSLNAGFSSATRLDATFGNPIYLASYMLFNVFMGALLFAQAFKENANRVRPYMLLYGAAIVFDSLILFMTGTRGTMLGLIGGTILAALLLILFGRNAGKMRKIAAGVIVIIMVLASAVFLVRDQAWVDKTPILGRLASISLSAGTVQARFMNWGMAWEGFKERPILGWGQENYAIVFSKYYNPQMYAQEQWFDRVHNVIFDWLIAGGILGLLGYLSILVFTLLMIWKRKAVQAVNALQGQEGISGSFTVAEKSILTGLLAAYFFHNLFVFDNIMSYMLFATVLAYIAFRDGIYTNATRVFSTLSLSPRVLPIIAILAIGVVWGAVWALNARPVAANRAVLQGLQPQSGGLSVNLEYFDKALAYHTIGTQEMREQLMQATVQLAGIQEVPLDMKERFLDRAGKELALQSEESPLDPRFPLFHGLLLNAYGAYDSAAPILRRAHELSPTKQTILFELAANAFARGDNASMLAYFKQAFDLAPEFVDARLMYAAAAIRTGDDALADSLLAPILSSGRVADARIAAAYVARGRYDKIVNVWEAHLQSNPGDVQAYFTLAAAYYTAGDKEAAIRVLQRVAVVDPQSKTQAEQLIRDIRNGTVQ